ncbi:hypothetical protein N7454_004031 [Penicillium verhagenii]|nr:hypothetical protein N7454_004031 [Penicillium verhagenii]
MASPIDPDSILREGDSGNKPEGATSAVSPRSAPSTAVHKNPKHYLREYRYICVNDVRANVEAARASYEMSKAAASTAKATYEAAKTLLRAIEKTSATSIRDWAKHKEQLAKKDQAVKREAETSPEDAEEEKTQEKVKGEAETSPGDAEEENTQEKVQGEESPE